MTNSVTFVDLAVFCNPPPPHVHPDVLQLFHRGLGTRYSFHFPVRIHNNVYIMHTKRYNKNTFKIVYIFCCLFIRSQASSGWKNPISAQRVTLAPVMSRLPPWRPRPAVPSSRERGLPRRLWEMNWNPVLLSSSIPLGTDEEVRFIERSES